MLSRSEASGARAFVSSESTPLPLWQITSCWCTFSAAAASTRTCATWTRDWEALAQLAGANYFPSLDPRLDSPALKQVVNTYKLLNAGKEPKVYSVHAGLECGLFKLSVFTRARTQQAAWAVRSSASDRLSPFRYCAACGLSSACG